MAATLNLLPRKKFEIVLEDKTISGQFGTWALFRFCKKRGVGLEGLYDALSKLEIDSIVDFVLCAIEQSCRERGESFTYTDVDLCKWIDDMEGTMASGLIAIFNHYGSDEEKKSQPPAEEAPLAGTTSSESQEAAG